MEVRVSEAHVRSYKMPVVADVGDRVRLKRQDDDAPEWVWVEHERTDLGGWTPKAFLETDETGCWAIFKRDYAVTELTVEVGQLVQTHESVAGWTWCKAMDLQTGWIPSHKLIPKDRSA